MRKNYNLEKRKYVIGAFVAIVAAIFIFRLFDLQIHDSTYKQSADSNAFLKKTVYPRAALSTTATALLWYTTSLLTT